MWGGGDVPRAQNETLLIVMAQPECGFYAEIYPWIPQAYQHYLSWDVTTIITPNLINCHSKRMPLVLYSDSYSLTSPP